MYFGLVTICLFIFTSAANADFNSVMQLKLSVSDDNKVTCDQNEEKQYNVTAFEGELLWISIDYTKLLHGIICNDKYNQTISHIVKSVPFTKAPITVLVTKNMGGDWICGIRMPRDNVSFKSKFTWRHVNYTVVYCYIKVHVRLSSTPQSIRVNNMLIKATKEPTKVLDVDYSAVYKYKDGDKVDILCFMQNDNEADIANANDGCEIVLKYCYKELKGKTMELASYTYIQSYIELKSKHNASYIDCISKCKRDIQIQRLTLISASNFDNSVELVINGQEARTDWWKESSDKVSVSADYHIFNDEHMNITCGVENSENYTCSNNCNNKYLEQYKCNIMGIRYINYKCEFYCSQTNLELVPRIILHLQTSVGIQVPFYLSLSISNNTVVMSFITNKERVIYYEFDHNDDISSVTCSKNMKREINFWNVTYLTTTHTNNTDTMAWIVNDTLKMTHHKEYTCYLYRMPVNYKNYGTLINKITVVFIDKSINRIQLTTMNSTMINSPGMNNIHIICLAVLAVVVMAIVAFITYRCYRKAKSMQNESLNFNLDVHSSAAISQDLQTSQVTEQTDSQLINAEVCNENQCHYAVAVCHPNKYNNNDYASVLYHDYADIIYDCNYDYVDTAHNLQQYDYVGPAYDSNASST